jgi:hypothetical protein
MIPLKNCSQVFLVRRILFVTTVVVNTVCLICHFEKVKGKYFMSEAMTMSVNQTNAEVSQGFLATTKNAMESGIADARASVEEAWPKITEAVGKGVYNSAYGLAFGLTIPVLLLAKTIPQNNCFVWGFVDGAKAASNYCERTFKE